MDKNTSSIIRFLRNFWKGMKGHTFKTEITNQPKMPDIKVPISFPKEKIKLEAADYPEDISVNNLIDYTDTIKDSSKDIIKYLDKALKRVESTNNNDKFFKKASKEIKGIKKVLKKKDLTPKILKEIKGVVKSIKKIQEPSIDLSGLDKKLTLLTDGFEDALAKYARYDEFKVRLPDKQVEKLSKSIVTSTSGGGTSKVSKIGGVQINPATEEKQDDIKTAVEGISGLQRATDMEGGGKISVGTTAVEATFSGTPESIIISADKDNTGQLYVGKSNVANDGSNAITYLNAGDVIEMDYDDTTNGIYVIANAASQNFWKGCLK